MSRLWAAVAVSAVVVTVFACGGSERPNERTGSGGSAQTADAGGTNGTDAGSGGADAGTDAGEDAGTPDAGDGDAGTDGGTDGGVDAGPTPGPWPTDAALNYSSEYKLGSIQSAGVDDAYNIWLLDGDRIGVLRPGTTSPVWVSGIGQAAPGFGTDKLANGSTVICGGAAGQAYVGYWTYDLTMPERLDPKDPEYKKGDLDVVELTADGKIQLKTHLDKSTGASNPWPYENIGIRNSNDWHYDEDRSVLVCTRVMKGQFKGEVYIGTNHGVTRIRGLEYNSHRHPVWAVGNSLRIGYNHGLGIGQNGDVLIANEWKVAIIAPPEPLGDFEFHEKAPWIVDSHNGTLNTLEEFDYWRGFQQTTDGQYYLGSLQFGLWRMEKTAWPTETNWFKVAGLPTEKITALQATDDGSLFIGTEGNGLWRMGADKKFAKVSDVSGSDVRQLVYDPTVTPAMLYVVIDDELFVLRGY